MAQSPEQCLSVSQPFGSRTMKRICARCGWSLSTPELCVDRYGRFQSLPTVMKTNGPVQTFGSPRLLEINGCGSYRQRGSPLMPSRQLAALSKVSRSTLTCYSATHYCLLCGRSHLSALAQGISLLLTFSDFICSLLAVVSASSVWRTLRARCEVVIEYW